MSGKGGKGGGGSLSAAAKARQAERKGVEISGVCPSTRMLARKGRPGVKVSLDSIFLGSLAGATQIRVVEKLSARERANRRAGFFDEVTEKELSGYRSEGSWDGELMVVLPGAQCAIGTDEAPRSRFGRRGKVKASGFDPAGMEIRVREHRDGKVRLVEPDQTQRRSIERALLVETLSNINPYAKESRRFSDQVIAAAAKQAVSDHGEPTPALLAGEQGLRHVETELRRLLADGMAPERAMFLAVHSALRAEATGALLAGGEDDRFAAVRAAYSGPRRRDATPSAAAQQRLAEIREGGPTGRARDVSRTVTGFRQSTLSDADDQTLAGRVPDGLKQLWTGPAAEAVRTMTAEPVGLHNAGAEIRDAWDAQIRDAIAAGEVAHPGFILAIALGGGHQADIAQRLIIDPDSLAIVADHAHTVDQRAAAALRIDELEVEPSKVAERTLRHLTKIVSDRPALLESETVRRQLLEAATLVAAGELEGDRFDDAVERARRAAEATYGRSLNDGEPWQTCVLNAVDAVARPYDGVLDEGKSRRVLAGVLLQWLADDGQGQ